MVYLFPYGANLMWIVSVWSVILMIISTLSNPMNNNSNQQLTPDSMDEFYREMRSTLDKLLDRSAPETTNEDGALTESFQNDFDYQELSDNYGMEKKLKRDDTEAEKHRQVETNPLLGPTPSCPCDKYEATSHTCINVRQIGTTLTLGVQMGEPEKKNHYHIRWFRYFKRRGSLSDVRKEFTKENAPWNINIGGENNELRISPITEIDFSYNYFIATIDGIRTQKKKREKSNRLQFIKFVIEPINIDMGTLYPGEELVIYARAYMELPLSSVTLEWSLSDMEFLTKYDLPSNMKINADGSSVIVKELRTSRDKVLTCSVFSNKNVFLARRNFLFRRIGATIKQVPTPASSQLNFKRRRKRNLQENEGFEYDGFEIKNEQPHFHVLNTDKYNNLNKQRRFYDSNKQFNHQNSAYFRNYQYPRESMEQADEGSLPINNELFYKDGGKTESYDEDLLNVRQSRAYPFSRQKTLQESQFKDDIHRSSRRNENPDYGANSRFRSRIPIQGEETPNEDMELLNNDEDNVDFSQQQKTKFNTRWAGEVVSPDERDRVRLTNGLIQQANRFIQRPTENSIPDTNEQSNHIDNEKYTFDDTESILIADCKDSTDCSIHAKCQKGINGRNFCRCIQQYNGNGIFCWLI